MRWGSLGSQFFFFFLSVFMLVIFGVRQLKLLFWVAFRIFIFRKNTELLLPFTETDVEAGTWLEGVKSQFYL